MNRSFKLGIATLAILCSFTVSSFADTFVEIAPSAARQVCENFLIESQAQTKGIDSVEMIRNRDIVVGYCFHLSPEGTVIVPAHKGLDPVLFFGEQGRLDLADTFGPGETFRSILSQRGSHGNHASWDHYLVDTKLFKAGVASQSAQKSLVGGPLLTTAWHQHAPFNNLCPERPDGYNAKVGCVPLAVAQIMNYHEWPNGGLGSRTKSGWYSPITADFTVPFDWNDMPDNCGLYAGDQGDQTNSCNVAESAAVARFCRDIGIAMDVIYGDGVGGNVGSSAVYSKVIEVLPWYFRYDDTIKQGASSTYTAAELFDLIRSEVDANRPILYSIGKTVGEEDFGHAVVVDGYSDRGGSYRYHVNFGNGPAGNGWWAIGSLPNDWQDRNFWYDIKPQDYLFVGPDPLFFDHTTIQGAIDASADGQIIKLLGSGDHRPYEGETFTGWWQGTGNRDIDFDGKNVTVRSEFYEAEACNIYCTDGPGTPGNRGFSFISGEDSRAGLESLTIYFAHAASKGSAIRIKNGSYPVISNCLIRNNITDNGPIVYVDGAAPTIRGCTITDNTGTALGLFNAAPVVENTIIAFNSGLEVDCGGLCLPNVSCSLVYDTTIDDWHPLLDTIMAAAGNYSQDPDFCDAGGSDYTISNTSVCAPANNSCGVLIGALGVACTSRGLSPVEHQPDVAAARNGAPVFGGNYPNPFNPATTLEFSLPRAAQVRLAIYDTRGRLISLLADDHLEAGQHSVTWRGRNTQGSLVAAGIYLAKLDVEGQSLTQKITLAK